MWLPPVEAVDNCRFFFFLFGVYSTDPHLCRLLVATHGGGEREQTGPAHCSAGQLQLAGGGEEGGRRGEGRQAGGHLDRPTARAPPLFSRRGHCHCKAHRRTLRVPRRPGRLPAAAARDRRVAITSRWPRRRALRSGQTTPLLHRLFPVPDVAGARGSGWRPVKSGCASTSSGAAGSRPESSTRGFPVPPPCPLPPSPGARSAGGGRTPAHTATTATALRPPWCGPWEASSSGGGGGSGCGGGRSDCGGGGWDWWMDGPGGRRRRRFRPFFPTWHGAPSPPLGDAGDARGLVSGGCHCCDRRVAQAAPARPRFVGGSAGSGGRGSGGVGSVGSGSVGGGDSGGEPARAGPSGGRAVSDQCNRHHDRSAHCHSLVVRY